MFSKIIFPALLFIAASCFSQEGVAVYSDYLSDNYYLIHPSMAGAANCDKVRLTIRNQWSGEEDAPALQTLSYNGRFDDKSGGGIILFNDRNGYHSQKGVKLTYAHRIMFSRDEIDLDLLTFGISGGLIQSQLDETGFLNPGEVDPNIDGNVQSQFYTNFDVGASYNFLDFYTHLTVKNAMEVKRKIYTDYETNNLRKYLLSAGYVFGDLDRIMWEPSFMFQLTEKTREDALDINLKAYKNFFEGMVWGGLSYRSSLDVLNTSNKKTATQKLQYITPIVGINYKNLMFAYTYSLVSGDIKFNNGAYHQITLGVNLFCRKQKYDCFCPAVN